MTLTHEFQYIPIKILIFDKITSRGKLVLYNDFLEISKRSFFRYSLWRQYSYNMIERLSDGQPNVIVSNGGECISFNLASWKISLKDFIEYLKTKKAENISVPLNTQMKSQLAVPDEDNNQLQTISIANDGIRSAKVETTPSNVLIRELFSNDSVFSWDETKDKKRDELVARGDAAVPALDFALDEKHLNHIGILRALGSIGTTNAVHVLGNVLARPDDNTTRKMEMYEEAVDALVAINSPVAIDVLRRAKFGPAAHYVKAIAGDL
ncbi:MAG: HEAT repeat domain-containing protein [Candidatus Aminicenantes bacterium]|nr:HEAT repeat domain-containing protein [Candidatus Aminicenantes bacterium]